MIQYKGTDIHSGKPVAGWYVHADNHGTATFIKTGDPVFVLGGKYRHGRMEYWINPGKFRLTDIGKMGKTVFLTIEDAEAKLAEWKAKNYDPMQEVPDVEI